MIAVIAKRANEESESKSKRLNNSWASRRKRAENGEIIIKKGKGIPYGLRVEDGKFVVEEEERREIKFVFESLLKYGINTTVTKLNETSKKKWSNATITRMIRSKTVIGCMPTHRLEYSETGEARKILTGYIENYYPSLIEKNLFYQAIDAMKERKQENFSGNRSASDFNIFRHCIFCADCGGKLYYDHRGSRYKDRFYPFFKCDNSKTQKHLCDAENIRFEFVFGSFLRCIKNIMRLANDSSMQKTSWGKRTQQFNTTLKSILKTNENTIEVLEEKLTELNVCRMQIENLNAQIVELNYSAPTIILKRLSDLEGKASQLALEIEVFGAKMDTEFEIEDEKSIVDLFMTEDGRQKINQFFKNNDIAFFAKHSKKDSTTYLEIKRHNDEVSERISLGGGAFPKKDILKEFGLAELQLMFNLTVE